MYTVVCSCIQSCGVLTMVNHISPHCAMTMASLGLLLGPVGTFCWDI